MSKKTVCSSKDSGFESMSLIRSSTRWAVTNVFIRKVSKVFPFELDFHTLMLRNMNIWTVPSRILVESQFPGGTTEEFWLVITSLFR